VLAGDGDTYTYTVNADGTDEQPLFSEGPSASPRWSSNGTDIHVFCCDDGMAAHVLDPETGIIQTSFPSPDPTLETFCGGAWSPDGKRLACEVFGVDDPSRTGIYLIRASDGGGLTRITSVTGGEDIPGDYSPDGDSLVFFRDSNEGKVIWVVNADGSDPHRLPIAPGCGGPLSNPDSFGCYSPSWSPDGQWIVFVRPAPDGSEENLWIVKADGSGLVRLTDGGFDDQPDWGPDPTA
jgi:TolB protein